MFSKILVANRGEIAVRIIRACKELGVRTVGVYSEADKDSLHAQLADESLCIGGPKPQDSYLNISAIISAAEITDSDAIHPGYGFLAENAHFAEVCESCGIKFIGPTPENIRTMGDKIQARRIMRKHSIPVIPGSLDPVNTKEDALKLAQKLQYPVIIKAAAGGGGRGMRICHSDVRLISAFITAQSEAEVAFGNSCVYVEKYLHEPRHIEIQIVADNYGNIVHLGERDCSIQRRYQKLIEETPSPAVDARLRKKLGEYAIKGAKAINYSNVGTMEFLLDAKTHKVYFMEMNTRIQVEHPVTEEVTGIDLVKLQIQLAAGQKLNLKQDKIKLKNHAIECRINAEDPEHDFIPSPGKIEFLYQPGGLGIRVDTHIYSGYTIPSHYDSLIAKLIVRKKTRQECIDVLKRALEEFMIDPVKTTIGFYRRVIEDSEFVKGNYNTHFLEKFLEENREE
ncbi:MAG: acetyl-CoA carboxylase biotin carboxylase subunit [Candidatus Omnitrophica bacterium]|nr:acetyl-CoA carboxylase biotin carboxylase subunit [Candidatus Omnitrophota bacterium]